MEWNLIVGPGSRMADLMAYLVPVRDGGDCARLTPLADLGQLFELEVESGRLILAADELELEDVGLVRRFLRARRDIELVLIGSDAGRRAVRSLASEPRVRTLSWPPDLDDLIALGRAPGGAEAGRAGARRTSPNLAAAPVASAPRARADALGEELSQIEAILGGAPSASVPRARPATAAPAAQVQAVLEEPEQEVLAEVVLEPAPRPPGAEAPSPPRETVPPPPAPAELARPAAPAEPARPAAPPNSAQAAPPNPAQAAPPAALADGPLAPRPYFRDQVADLADLAQRIELGVAAVRETAQDAPDAGAALDVPLDGLHQDVARLLQFTRTLGYQVAPPAGGSQRFELGELLEVFVQALVNRGAEAPRCLWRKQGSAPVLSDRQLLSQAFDALFYVAGHCATRGEIVRVQLKTDAPGEAQVTIEFPGGPLIGRAPESLLQPYALREVLPELGPNALLAAAGILRGQGGSVRLDSRNGRHFAWHVRLPLAGAGPASAGREPSADDPFA